MIDEKFKIDLNLYIACNYNPEFAKPEIYYNFVQPLNEKDLYAKSCREVSYSKRKSLSIKEELVDSIFELDESFSQMVLRKIDEKGIKDSDCYNKANIDRRLFSKIRSDEHYKPSKQTAIALGLALELPKSEFNTLLNKAGYSFSRAVLDDVIVSFFIENGNYNISDLDEVLLQYDLKPISRY